MNVATWIGVVVGAGALVFAYLAWRVSQKQLRFAQEEATLRPRIKVSLKDVVFHYRPPNPGARYVQAAVVFNIANTGRSAAHNVRCEVRLEEQYLVPDDMHGKNYPFAAEYMGPSQTDPYQINVGIRAHGPTKAHYRCICDEVGEANGVVEFTVPQQDHQ